MELHHIHHLEHHYGVCFQQGNVQSYHTRENVTCKQSNECGIYMAGFAERPLQNIVLKNVTIGKVPTPYCFQNGENIRFQNVKINGKKLDEKPTPKELVKLRVL